MNELQDSNKSNWNRFVESLRDRFNLDEDKASEEEVRANIRKGVEFRGTNLWVLIFAIFIASIGLNVNSTAVIVGAMLISPLMGPIMGVGLALGVNNFDVMKRSLRSLGLAALVGLITSTLYFWISPLSTAQSELLARTTPTIYDVLIALFGGMAGIVAQSRKDRTSTVIPGVAIATALMPPLCTAGFGLARGNMAFFIGAFYLFFINAVFIAVGTFIIVRFLKYKKVEFVDPKKELRARRYMTVIVTITLVPSVILAYGIVQRTIFESNAKNYIDKVLNFDGSEIISAVPTYAGDSSTIEVMLVGKKVSEDVLDVARRQMEAYSLKHTTLIVRQAGVDNTFDTHTLQNVLRSNTEMLDEKNRRIEELERLADRYLSDTLPVKDISHELRSLWGSHIRSVSLAKAPVFGNDGNAIDTAVFCYLTTAENVSLDRQQREKLTQWLRARTKMNKVELIVARQEADTASMR
ncbi:TIGR00341 family protein [Millionella massiliensis]|uniref:TIGR00341 family protein n=1 Tax=Millionella massiliensis TaxID=1871023 RepID=UPI0023A810C1|nr:TIGR00341 family protein [Millionella massiliensis]